MLQLSKIMLIFATLKHDMAIDKVNYWLDIADYDITNFNIEARYPEDKEALSRMLTEEVCRKLIDETKQLQQWIKDRL